MNNPRLHYLLSKVRPDIVWFRDSREIEVVCIMEVMADKDRMKTIRKIGLDMIQQLRFLSNRNDAITSVRCFCFLLGTGHVEEALTWEDCYMYFGFYLTSEVLSSGAMRDWLWQEGKEHLDQLVIMNGIPSRDLTLPCSLNFLFSEFWHCIIQLAGGKSLVIFNENADQVYKFSFGHDE